MAYYANERLWSSGAAPAAARKYFPRPLRASALKPLTSPVAVIKSVPSAAASAQAATAQPNSVTAKQDEDPVNAGLRREPGLEPHKDIAPEKEPQPVNEFDPDADEPERESANNRALVRNMRHMARQISMDPGDNMEL